ncbi:MAG: hypothetical protein ACK4E3_10520 [Brevundimonas sp.]|uniref:hypothetical protein n=1 Tax=Brevundimonas sp. TaxID=1871086 RepID=UPI0039187ECF
MQRVRSLFGGRTRAERRAQRDAELAARQAQRQAEEDAQRERSERTAAGRRLRGAGRAALTWEGQRMGAAQVLGG